MLLTISTSSTSCHSARDLSFLLHKHPDKFQSFRLSFGQAHVFYPVLSDHEASVALALEIDPVGTVRGKSRDQAFLLDHYVNDRPYVASSFLSVAIAQVFGSALAGRCLDRPELVNLPIPLEARLEVLPVRGGGELVERLFAPLGYAVATIGYPLDDRFPEWGRSSYYSVALAGTSTLSRLLSHLYVLIPVFDNDKHYYVGPDELEKLLAKGAGWLATHPEKDLITRRYLGNRVELFRTAWARLIDEEAGGDADESATEAATEAETAPEKTPEKAANGQLALHRLRHEAVLAALRASGARSVLDLGCGDGKLLPSLLADRQFNRIVGLDVSLRSLQFARRRLKLDDRSAHQADRLTLWHGSLMYRDSRLAGFDAAVLVEVIEHLDPPRLVALERVVFGYARPATVVVTTPNREYNVKWEALSAGEFRHGDHRFEWTRSEFAAWAAAIGGAYGYTIDIAPVGPIDEAVGAPTQMCVFRRPVGEVFQP